MKKTSLNLFVFITILFFSCTKEKNEPLKQIITENLQITTSSKIRWRDLPAEFRDAVSVETATETNTITTNRSASEIVNTLGPYGAIKGSGFSIFPPTGSTVTAIGLGDDGGSNVTNLTIWYKTSSGVTTKAQAGKVTDESLIDFHSLTTNEYVLSVSGSRNTYLTQLTIKTNTGSSVSAGSTGSTAFTGGTVPGFWLFGFWGYASDNRIHQVNFDIHCKPWEKLNGSSGRDIAVAANGANYMTNTVGKIYKMGSGGTTWTQLAGSDGRNIAANANRVAMVNTAGLIYELLGSNWRQLPGSDAVDVAINSDGKIWMVNNAGKIYRYNETSWELMPGSSAARIAAGNNQVWLINSSGNIYQWNGTSWNQRSGSDGKDIAVGNDGNVWLTNTSGILYRWTGAFFFELCGSSGSTIAANNSKVMMINSGGSFYKLAY